MFKYYVLNYKNILIKKWVNDWVLIIDFLLYIVQHLFVSFYYGYLFLFSMFGNVTASFPK